MRVTAAPACANSCAATADNFALSEPVRSDPGITRIFSADILEIAFRLVPLTDSLRVFYSQTGRPIFAEYAPISLCDTPRPGPAEDSSRSARKLPWTRPAAI